MPGTRNLAREQAAHDASTIQARVYTMLAELLPAYDRALIGQHAILEHLERLGIRRRNGRPLPWRIVLRWRRSRGFPVLRGFQYGTSRSPSFTTQHAVAAWLLSHFTTNAGAPFAVGTYGVNAVDGNAPQGSSSAPRMPDRAA